MEERKVNLTSGIGSYTIANSISDMVIMIIFGLVGYLMKKFDYEMAPMVMGLVLGPLMEKTFRTSMLMSHGSPGIFFRRPISMVLLVLALLVLISPLITKKIPLQELVEGGILEMVNNRQKHIRILVRPK